MKRHLRLVSLVLASVLWPCVASAQAGDLSTPAGVAFHKGVIAAKLPNYLLAIRYFEEARQLDPKNGVVYYNLGLAESQIPGRELRAISWLGAYLAASPAARNAQATVEQMHDLAQHNRDSLRVLLKLVLDAAKRGAPDGRDKDLAEAAALFAEAGEVAGAVSAAGLIRDPLYQCLAKFTIAGAHAERVGTPTVAGALDFAKVAAGQLLFAKVAAGQLLEDPQKSRAHLAIAEAQIKARDVAGARDSLKLAKEIATRIPGKEIQEDILLDISRTGLKVALINLRAQNLANPPPTATPPPNPPVLTSAEWITLLDDAEPGAKCPLKTGLFVDLYGYLKTPPPADDPGKAFQTANATVRKYLGARMVVLRMLDSVDQIGLADTRAKAEKGDAQAQLTVGRSYTHSQGGPADWAQAAKWFRQSGAQGQAEAQFLMGMCYLGGKGVPADLGEGVKWLRMAAVQGHPQAQHVMGTCYATGDGVPKDLGEAAKWFQAAAKQGHAVAQFLLSSCYADGRGVPKDATEALKWLHKAAEQGHTPAQSDLASRYLSGEGATKDLVEAAKWIQLAAAQGDDKAIALKSLIETKMTPKQLARAQELSSAWKPKATP